MLVTRLSIKLILLIVLNNFVNAGDHITKWREIFKIPRGLRF